METNNMSNKLLTFVHLATFLKLKYELHKPSSLYENMNPIFVY